MKLAAITKRGARRDYWDLHAMLTCSAVRLPRALDDYRRKFGVAESDIYHVLKALSWFDDAERDDVLPWPFGAPLADRSGVLRRRGAAGD
jgi:hypothetical protein